MRQNQMVLKHLLEGKSITQLEAMNEYGIMRLGARIFELIQDGYPIKKQMVIVRNRRGEPCMVAKYYMEDKNESTEVN